MSETANRRVGRSFFDRWSDVIKAANLSSTRSTPHHVTHREAALAADEFVKEFPEAFDLNDIRIHARLLIASYRAIKALDGALFYPEQRLDSDLEPVLLSKIGADRESIAAAAIIFKGQTISLPPPARHHTIMKCAVAALAVPQDEWPCSLAAEQCGFLTSAGRYVDRKDAFEIALRAWQFRGLPHNPGELYSEDLW